MTQIKRIDHVAIAVKNCDESTRKYVKLLNAEHIRTTIISEKGGPIKVSYLRIGESIISLVQSLEEDGFINKHMQKHGEGLHHLGLEVDDLDSFIKELQHKGYDIPLHDEFSNRKEIVLHPKDAAGVILQLIEWKGVVGETVEERIKRILEFDNLPEPR